jgi:hypothetical protein
MRVGAVIMRVNNSLAVTAVRIKRDNMPVKVAEFCSAASLVTIFRPIWLEDPREVLFDKAYFPSMAPMDVGR